tara:strand:- start:608 stop:1186 length:579 start_codon:yes stop_codon:yes gene_type:complete
MVNVDCAGGQDRATTTSETHPYIPPRKTRNCYTTGGNASFDSSNCGTSGDRACSGAGGNGNLSHCIPDNEGGYCKVGNNYYVARGSNFFLLTQEQLLNRYRDGSGGGGDTDETGRAVRRALNDQERRFTNRIRELQIMGKDPLVQRSSSKKEDDNKEVHSFIGNMLFNVGIGISFVIFIISVCIILIQNKII